jgi:tetraacyldisaccharide 4'-kinase
MSILLQKTHDFYIQLISNQKQGLICSVLKGALFLFSCIYEQGIKLRKLLYQKGYKKQYRPQAFTISIGNITAGGTGKTPFTIFLAQKLMEQYKLAVLTRGYKSKTESATAPIVIQEKAIYDDVGDEACVLARKLPQIPIYVGKDRTASAKLAVENGAEILLLDDGMQHLKLYRDLEIVIIDAQNPFGYGYLLPRGLLREPISALARADLVVINRASLIDKSSDLEALVRDKTLAPIMKTDMIFAGTYDMQGEKVELVKGTKVALFCAIGNPRSFYELVKRLGLEIVHYKYLVDHAEFDEMALEAFAETSHALGASYLICTEKDIVKLSPHQECTLPILSLRVQLQVLDGQKFLDGIYKRIAQLLGRG